MRNHGDLLLVVPGKWRAWASSLGQSEGPQLAGLFYRLKLSSDFWSYTCAHGRFEPLHPLEVGCGQLNVSRGDMCHSGWKSYEWFVTLFPSAMVTGHIPDGGFSDSEGPGVRVQSP